MSVFRLFMFGVSFISTCLCWPGSVSLSLGAFVCFFNYVNDYSIHISEGISVFSVLVFLLVASRFPRHNWKRWVSFFHFLRFVLFVCLFVFCWFPRSVLVSLCCCYSNELFSPKTPIKLLLN